MRVTLGIDPGKSGACAVMYDTGELTIDDMPIFSVIVNHTKRKRIDPVAWLELCEGYKLIGVDRCVLELVGGRPNQPGAFAFGEIFGITYMGLVAAKLPVDRIPASVWKKKMGVSGKASSGDGQKSNKTKEADDAVIMRADQVFPNHRHLFRGPNGGKRPDRAEAALMAKFAMENL